MCLPCAGSFYIISDKQQLYKADEIHNCVKRRLVQQIDPQAVFADLLQKFNAAFVKALRQSLLLCPFAEERAE